MLDRRLSFLLLFNLYIWSGIYQAAVWSNLVPWDRYPADIPWFGASCVVRCNNTSWVHQWWWTAHNHYADTPGTWSVFPLFHFHPEKDDTESPAFNLLMMHFSWISSRVMTNSPSFSWQFHTIYESVPFFRMKLFGGFFILSSNRRPSDPYKMGVSLIGLAIINWLCLYFIV